MPDISNLSGPIGIRLVNDRLFRILLQKNNRVLKGLIASLLHMNEADISSVRIENEAVLGEDISEKEFILDIRIRMNDDTIINLEMQVIDLHNWVERSMSYLCRNFDNLSRGEDYVSVRPSIQIGLLNYTLFPEAPEFYATYYLMNEKTHQKYSDKLRLSVLDLTQINLATDEDKHYDIHLWASLFKAQKWEDLKMIAKNNEVITSAVSTIYEITQDQKLVEYIRYRDEEIAEKNRMQTDAIKAKAETAEAKKEATEAKKEAAEAKKETSEAKKETSEAKKEAAEAKKETAEAKKETAEMKKEITKTKKQLAKSEQRIAELEEALRQAQGK